MDLFRKALLICSALYTVGAQAPAVSLEPGASTVRQGESVSFRCRATRDGSQAVQLEWRRTDNQPLQDNVKIGPDGSVLTVASARPGNQGQYRCIATGPAGRSTATATLTIKQSPKVQVTPAGPVVVRAGDPLSLECRASGRPRPSVTWRRPGSAHQPAAQGASTVQVAASGPQHAGEYVCRAQNAEGVAEVKVAVVVETGGVVAAAPAATVTRETVMAVEGQSVALECRSGGSPPPVLSWSKLRAPLPWRHAVEGGVLTLTGVGRQDSGQYICNATNAHGTSQAFTQLEVEAPPYAACLPDQLRLRPGDALRVQCLAHGSHPITFQWSRVGGAGLPQGAETTRDGKLLIGRVKTTDGGSYECAATNHLGTGHAQVKVTVRA